MLTKESWHQEQEKSQHWPATMLKTLLQTPFVHEEISMLMLCTLEALGCSLSLFTQEIQVGFSLSRHKKPPADGGSSVGVIIAAHICSGLQTTLGWRCGCDSAQLSPSAALSKKHASPWKGTHW